MSEESTTLRAIKITRVLLDNILLDPHALIQMAAHDVAPDDVENVVTEILEYLEKTKEEAEAR